MSTAGYQLRKQGWAIEIDGKLSATGSFKGGSVEIQYTIIDAAIHSFDLSGDGWQFWFCVGGKDTPAALTLGESGAEIRLKFDRMSFRRFAPSPHTVLRVAWDFILAIKSAADFSRVSL